MIRRLLFLFGVRWFKVGDIVKPNYKVFKKEYVFPNKATVSKIIRIDYGIIFLENIEIPFTNQELSF